MMDPQEGDIADLPDGRTAVYRGGKWVVQGGEAQPADSGYQLRPMTTPAERRAQDEVAYRREQDAIQRQRQIEADRRAEEQLRLSQEAAARAEAAANPTTPRATPEMRGRLEFGLPVAVRARQRLNEMEGRGYSLNQDWGAALIDYIPDWNLLEPVARGLGGDDYQRYDQAAASIEAALLPIFSGLAVTESEAKRFIKANQPQLGDGPGRLREKARNIMEVLNAGSRLAGRPLPFPEVGIYGVSSPEQPEPTGVGANISIGGDAPPPAGGPDPNGLAYAPGEDLVIEGTVDRGAITERGGKFYVGGFGPENEVIPRGNGDYIFVRDVGPNTILEPNDPNWGRNRAAIEDAQAAYGSTTPGQVAALTQGVSYGFADEIGAKIDAAGTAARNALTPGADPYSASEAEAASLAVQRDRMRQFSEEHPGQDFALRMTGGVFAPGMKGLGQWAAGTNRARGLMAGTGLAPQMGRSAVAGAVVGGAYGAGSAEGGLEGRMTAAGEGATAGAVTGALVPPGARMAGIVGRAAEPVTRPVANIVRRMAGRPIDDGTGRRAADLARGRAPQQMEADAAEIRAYGGEPVLADLIGDAGQGRVRSMASRSEAGRDAAVDFGASRRVGAQDYVAGLGERVSPVNMSAEQIESGLNRMQSALSAPQFAAVRSATYTPSERALTAFRLPAGRQALRDAASTFANSMDDAERAYGTELLAFADALDNGQVTPMSIGAADLASRYLLQDATRMAAREGGANLSRLTGDIGRAIRDDARTAVPEYGRALDAYAARARLGDAVETGERFIGNKGDARDFAAAMAGLGDAERGVVRAASRAAIERAAQTPASAAGTLDALAVGRGQNVRSGALLGPSAAADLQRGAQVGRRMLMTGRNVNPRQGSETALNMQDALGLAGNAARGNVSGLLRQGVDFLRSRGVSDAEAERIVSLALDPQRTDEAIRLLTQRFGPDGAREMITRIVRAAPAVSGASAAREVQPSR